MHSYTMNQVSVPGQSEFDLSKSRKLSTNFGRLVPFNYEEVYPGETFKFNSEQLIRFQPLLSPVMHEVSMDINHFFVPFRILWDGWERFITSDSAEAHPYVTGMNVWGTGSLADHLGFPEGNANTANLRFSAFPCAAYLKIFDDWYRDQNLVETQFPDDGLVPGDNTGPLTFYMQAFPLPGSLQHDYFTSCLPFPSKGADVRIPVFLNGDGVVELAPLDGTPMLVREDDGTAFGTVGTLSYGATVDGQLQSNTTGEGAVIDPNGMLLISEQEIGTIRALRLASVLQEWYEKQAIAGSRYNETILSHFGTFTGDARLQRAEHIGGYTQRVRFSEVLSTASTEVGSDVIPVGLLAGHGVSYGDSRTFTYSAKEHGCILSILRVRPKTAYQQGTPRFLLRNSLFDYMWPTFANIGDQEVTKLELYSGLDSSGVSSGETADELTELFGYQERYAELKTGFDTVHGDFKETLKFWHLCRTFDEVPVLNFEFLRADQDEFGRIFAVVDGPDPILIHVEHNIKAARALPVYSDPTL